MKRQLGIVRTVPTNSARGWTVLFAVFVAALLSGGNALAADWERLDNGIDLAGWHKNGARWYVANGAIQGEQEPPGSGNGGILLTDRLFADDIEVKFEVWPVWGQDSGFYLRSTENGEAYQVTIDYQEGQSVGGIYGAGIGAFQDWDFTVINGGTEVQGTPQFFNKADWPQIWHTNAYNEFTVRITGNPPRIEVWINGTKVNEFQDTQVRLPATGSLALQVHEGNQWPNGSVIKFRNIRVLSLTGGNTPPTVNLTADTTSGAEPLTVNFNANSGDARSEEHTSELQSH